MTINLTALQKQRYDTAANWTGANPTLLAGEIGIESDTLRWKVGNGSTAWTSLGYIPGLAYGTARQLLQTNSGATAAEWTSNVDIPGTLDVTGTSTLDGMVLMGTTTSIGGGKLQLSSDTTTTIQNFSFNATADSSTAMLQFIRGRGTKASPSVVLNGDYLGEIRFLGYGTTYNTGASIRAIVDGDPATAGDTSDMPTKLVFLTSPNGSSTPDTRMTIDSAGLVTIPGDLTVNGTTTTINSTTLVVQDKNIEMGVVATPTDVTADGGGITLKGTTDKTINWIDATDAWTLSEHVNIASAKEYRIAGTKVLDATSLGNAVVSSSLTSVGTIGTGVWQGSTIGKAYGGTGQTSYTDGQLLIGNSTGNTLTKSTLTAGSNITITNGNGSITIASSNPGGTVTNVSGTAPISVANGTTTPAISIAAATTSVVGAVQLSDSTSTTSSVLAATPTAVKAAYDLAAAALPLAGGTVTGNLEIGTAGSLSFEGATADGFETTIAVVDPTADRTITLPNTTGTVVTTGDTGTVTSTMLLDGTILNEDINASASIAYSKLATLTSGNIVLGSSANVATSTAVTGDVTITNAGVTAIAAGVIVNADVNASAAIAGSKVAPDFGAQNIVTTGSSTAATFNPTGTTAPVTGVYSPGANRLGITTNSVERVEFGTSEVVFNDDAADYDFRIEGDTNSNLFFADASAEAVGIRTATPVSEFNVSVGNGGNITISNTNDAHSAGLAFGDTTSNSSGRITYDHSTNALGIIADGTQRLTINNAAATSTLPVVHPLGAAATPSLTFTGDTNTGIYSPGADQLAISTNGTGRLRVSSTGTVEIVGAGTIGSTQAVSFNGSAPVNSMALDSSGRLGIGTSTPGAKLDVSGDVIFNGGGTQFPIQFANAFTPNAQRADLFFSANATSNNALRVGTIASNGGVTLQGTRQSDSSQKVNLVLNPDGGSVGIGTSSPNNTLHVAGTGSTQAIFERTGSNGAFIGLKDGSANNVFLGNTNGVFSIQTPGSSFSDKLVVTSAGLVGIGTTGPDVALHVATGNATGYIKIDGGTFSNATNGLLFRSGSNTYSAEVSHYLSNLSLYTAGTERARIDSSGRLLVGTIASPAHQLQVSTDSAGKPSTNTWTIVSDERIKEEIELADLDLCYQAVKNIPLKRFKWKDEVYTEEQVRDRRKLGWIAQDVEAVFPKAVGTYEFKYNQVFKEIIIPAVEEELDDDGNITTPAQPERIEKGELISEDVIEDCRDLNSDQLYAAMYGAIQKLMIKVEVLETEIASLKAIG